MKRWRTKNPRPQPHQAHAAKKSTQPSRARDGRPKRRDRVATVAREANDDEWVSLSILSSDTPCVYSDRMIISLIVEPTFLLSTPRKVSRT